MTWFPLPLGATGPAQAEPRSLAAIGLMETDLGRTYSGLMGIAAQRPCSLSALYRAPDAHLLSYKTGRRKAGLRTFNAKLSLRSGGTEPFSQLLSSRSFPSKMNTLDTPRKGPWCGMGGVGRD